MKDLSLCINEKVEQGRIERKAVHGAEPIFAQEKRTLPGDLTARNEITIKEDDCQIAKKSEISKQD